jgi:hypothetical protein
MVELPEDTTLDVVDHLIAEGEEWTCLVLVESGLVSAAHLEPNGADEAERGMAPAGIVEAVDVAGQSLGRFRPRLEAVRQTNSLFSVLKNVSTIALS